MDMTQVSNKTIILTRSDVAQLLGLDDCIDAVENAFALYAQGKAAPPSVLAVHASEGAFHIKSGIMQTDKNYFVSKTNANYPRNPSRYGLPTIQGVVVVCDGDDGRLLALMDSMELTTLRTGAATAVAARYLSRKNSKVAMIWGCGVQGRISARMIAAVRPIETIYLYDLDSLKAEAAAA